MLGRIVGIDPGKTTGIVSFTINENEIWSGESYELDLVDTGNYLASIPNISEIETIIAYEVANKFQVSGHMSSEVIGLARYFALKAGIEFVPVTQSSHKKLITRDVLKRAGLYVPGTHAKDAAGVGLFTAVNCKLIDPWFLRPKEA